MKNVVVYTLHEEELDEAMRIIKGGEAAERVVVGELDEVDIEKLRASGLVVRVLEDLEQQKPDLPEQDSVEMAVAQRAFREEAAPRARRAAYWVYLRGPLLPAWRKQLEQLTVQILSMEVRYALETHIEMAFVPKVRELKFVRRVAAIGATHRAAPRLASFAPALDAAPEPLTYDVLAQSEEVLKNLAEWLKSRNVAVVGMTRRKLRFQSPENPALQQEIRSFEGVLAAEVVDEPGLHNDRARDLMRLDALQPNPAGAGSLDGDGEIVGVADTGIDEAHVDFAGRIVGTKAYGRNGQVDDPHGHGTHVAGTVLGSGASSGGKFRGAAPKAKLYFQSLIDAEGKLGGLPLDLEQLFDDAYAKNVRVHNNSWGALAGSEYRMRSLEVDRYVSDHRDMVIVFSAGNAGTDADPALGVRAAPRGHPDWYSIGAPATSKNAIVVGASRSDRQQGGYAAVGHGVVWPSAFKEPPIRDERVSGDPEQIAGFSSRGPCREMRIKPDVVAPGTDVFSCKSSLAPLRRFAGLDPAYPAYGYMCGTSMSAPLVSGCAATVREYFRKKRNHAPSAALVKAVLINSTRSLSGQHSIAGHAGLPNVHQGFGRIDMGLAVPATANPAFKLEFYDNWQRQQEHFIQPGMAKRFRLKVAPKGWLRICLAYTDAPGRGLQNNLSVYLEQQPRGQKVLGNGGGQFGIGQPDALNNVETIRLDEASGDYYIHVLAENVLVSPQDFALVVSGPTIASFAVEF